MRLKKRAPLWMRNTAASFFSSFFLWRKLTVKGANCTSRKLFCNEKENWVESYLSGQLFASSHHQLLLNALEQEKRKRGERERERERESERERETEREREIVFPIWWKQPLFVFHFELKVPLHPSKRGEVEGNKIGRECLKIFKAHVSSA